MCAFPWVIMILVNFCTFLILGVFPAVMVFALCISPLHPVAAVHAQPALPDPWPTVSEFLPSSICIASKESCWIVHLRLFWISEAVLLLQWILWHKPTPFFLSLFWLAWVWVFLNRNNSGNWSLCAFFEKLVIHYCTVSSSILLTAIWVM